MLTFEVTLAARYWNYVRTLWVNRQRDCAASVDQLDIEVATQ
jgi:hypothetical protein